MARPVAVGLLLSAADRQNLLFALERGGTKAERDLAEALSRAVTPVANTALKRQFFGRIPTAQGEAVRGEAIPNEANDKVRQRLE